MTMRMFAPQLFSDRFRKAYPRCMYCKAPATWQPAQWFLELRLGVQRLERDPVPHVACELCINNGKVVNPHRWRRGDRSDYWVF